MTRDRGSSPRQWPAACRWYALPGADRQSSRGAGFLRPHRARRSGGSRRLSGPRESMRYQRRPARISNPVAHDWPTCSVEPACSAVLTRVRQLSRDSRLKRTIARPIVSRMGWSLADQALTSLTNFALGIVVARSVGPSDFGAFSLAFATYLAMLNASRAVATQPLLIRYVAVPAAVWRRGTQMATGTVLVLGL